MCGWKPEYIGSGLHHLTLAVSLDDVTVVREHDFSVDGTVAPMRLLGELLLRINWQLCLTVGTLFLLAACVTALARPQLCASVMTHLFPIPLVHRFAQHWLAVIQRRRYLRGAMLAVVLYSLAGPIMIGQVLLDCLHANDVSIISHS